MSQTITQPINVKMAIEGDKVVITVPLDAYCNVVSRILCEGKVIVKEQEAPKCNIPLRAPYDYTNEPWFKATWEDPPKTYPPTRKIGPGHPLADHDFE
jgi:hypothetical protein